VTLVRFPHRPRAAAPPGQDLVLASDPRRRASASAGLTAARRRSSCPSSPAVRTRCLTSPATRTPSSLTLRAGERRRTLRLAPQLGEVKIAVRPPDAELSWTASPRQADQTLLLLP
jgi:hypothetical protein